MPSPAAPTTRRSGRSGIPTLPAIDSSVSLLREGYTFISSRCDRLGADAFRTRLMLTPVVCMRGAEAAALVYDSGHFDRAAAVPRLTLRLLQDEGSVQQLTGEAHRVRKAMFMAMMTPQALDRARAVFAEQLHAAVPRWQSEGRVVLHEAVRDVLTRTACAWAGVPLAEEEAAERSREIGAMIDQPRIASNDQPDDEDNNES
jgi:fatty-acid peroxygenase